MLWISIALVGYFFLAVTFILDKYILSESSVGRPSVYTFYSTIIMWGALVLLLIDPGFFSIHDILIGLGSGVAFGFGLYFLYIAVKGGEASHVNPFNGAIVTLATYGLAHTFLGEMLTPLQLGGIMLLVIASVFLSYEETKGHNGTHIGYVWAIVSGIFFAVSHVSAKYLYEIHEFIPAFAWTRAGTGIVGLLLLFVPAVRRDIMSRFFAQKKKIRTKKHLIKHSLTIVWIAKIIAVVAVVLIQYAAAIGSVSIVFALSGLQYALMFVVIYALSRWYPRIFKEFFTTREVAIQSFAILLVIVGSFLIVFT